MKKDLCCQWNIDRAAEVAVLVFPRRAVAGRYAVQRRRHRQRELGYSVGPDAGFAPAVKEGG